MSVLAIGLIIVVFVMELSTYLTGEVETAVVGCSFLCLDLAGSITVF